MATTNQLRQRWLSGNGQKTLESIYSLHVARLGHGHSSAELYALLGDLPFRDEVVNGRDFRAICFGARDLHLSECDFSFAQISNFYYCDLSGSKFDQCTGERASFHNKVNKCTFIGAKLRSCYFVDSEVRGCTFDKARLGGCSFKNADLTGSSFRNADCRRAVFADACLVGCDFRGANLEQAVFENTRVDKSTDIRGASLVNAYVADRFDNSGKLVVKGTDFRLARFDSTTQIGNDPDRIQEEIRRAVISALNERNDALAHQILSIITESGKEWEQTVDKRLQGDDRVAWENIMDDVYRML